jgi:hypothetical protein
MTITKVDLSFFNVFTGLSEGKNKQVAIIRRSSMPDTTSFKIFSVELATADSRSW